MSDDDLLLSILADVQREHDYAIEIFRRHVELANALGYRYDTETHGYTKVATRDAASCLETL